MKLSDLPARIVKFGISPTPYRKFASEKERREAKRARQAEWKRKFAKQGAK